MTLNISYGYFVNPEPRDRYNKPTFLGDHPWKIYWETIREYMEDFLPKYYKKYLGVDVCIRYLWLDPYPILDDKTRGNIVNMAFTMGENIESAIRRTSLDWIGVIKNMKGVPCDHFHLMTNVPTAQIYASYNGKIGGIHQGLISSSFVPDWVFVESQRFGFAQMNPMWWRSHARFLMQATDGGKLIVSGHELTHAVLDYRQDGKLDLSPYEVMGRPIDEGELSGGVFLDGKLEPLDKNGPGFSDELRWMAQRLTREMPCHFPLRPCPG